MFIDNSETPMNKSKNTTETDFLRVKIALLNSYKRNIKHEIFEILQKGM